MHDEYDAGLAAKVYVTNGLRDAGLLEDYEEVEFDSREYRGERVIFIKADKSTAEPEVDSAIWTHLSRFAMQYGDELDQQGIRYLAYDAPRYRYHIVASVAEFRAFWRGALSAHELEKALEVVDLHTTFETPNKDDDKSGGGGNAGGGNGGGGSGGEDDKPGSTSGLKRLDRAVISGGYATTVATGEVEHRMQSLRDDVGIALESFGGLVRGLS